MKLADYAPPEQISHAINADHPEEAGAVGRSRMNAGIIGRLAEDTDQEALGRLALEQTTGFSLEDFNALPDEEAAQILLGLRDESGEVAEDSEAVEDAGAEVDVGDDWSEEEEDAELEQWLAGEGMTLAELESLPDELYEEVIDRYQEEAGGFEDEGDYELEEDYYGDDEAGYEDAGYEDAYEQAGPAQGGGYGEGGFE
jgi:hypothetical protein